MDKEMNSNNFMQSNIIVVHLLISTLTVGKCFTESDRINFQ